MAFLITLNVLLIKASLWSVNSHVSLLMREVVMLIKLSLKTLSTDETADWSKGSFESLLIR